VSHGEKRNRSAGVIPSQQWRAENTPEKQAVIGAYPPLHNSRG